MAGGYQVPKSDLDALKDLLTGLQRQINELRSSAGVTSAVITDKVTGARIAVGEGKIRFWTNYEADPDIFTTLDAIPVSGFGNQFWIKAPNEPGEGFDTDGIRIGGATSSGPSFFNLQGGSVAFGAQATMYFAADDRITFRANAGMSIYSGGDLRLYELPTTGGAANLRLETSSGDPVVQFVTSSRRYKRDIEDAPIDTQAFLRLRPRSWRDKGEVERDPETTTRNHGFIAEEVADLGLPFVDFNADGQPDALQYDRFMVGAVQVMQEQAAEIAALKQQNAAILARLDALENN